MDGSELPLPHVLPFKRLDGEPVFDEPWQAQALAFADVLIESKIISPTIWSATLGDTLKQAAAAGATDNMETYYQSVLKSVEKLLEQTSGILPEEIENKSRAWAEAYLATPHGQPVMLGNSRRLSPE